MKVGDLIRNNSFDVNCNVKIYDVTNCSERDDEHPICVAYADEVRKEFRDMEIAYITLDGPYIVIEARYADDYGSDKQKAIEDCKLTNTLNINRASAEGSSEVWMHCFGRVNHIGSDGRVTVKSYNCQNEIREWLENLGFLITSVRGQNCILVK
jgi:hypothetical protein